MASQIKRVAILGAGVMGSGIAAHLANAGVPTLLYDMVPRDAGESQAARNALALNGIEVVKKMRPPAFYTPKDAALITPCNYDDHADLLKTADLIIEVVVELLPIKKKVFEWVAANRAEGAVVTSNTSGISLAAMTEGMSEEMRQHFLVTHFFNPVRYMRLLELVKNEETLPEVADRLASFGEKVLGKGIIWGKDTPNFVANRIGVYGMASVFRHMVTFGMGVKEIDTVFGPAMGRAKSAVFRTGDLVGLDTLAHVFDNVYDGAPEDEERETFVVPAFLKQLIAENRLGDKTGGGFYKKVFVNGKKEIHELDLETMGYRPSPVIKHASVGKAKGKDTPDKKVAAIIAGDDPAAKIAWAVLADTAIYSANRIPEIADDVLQIDRGMKWGFGWDLGPFETWDAMGVRSSVERMKAEGRVIPAWVEAMLDAGRESFYQRDADGNLTYWSPDGQPVILERSCNHYILDDARAKGGEIKRNAGASLFDMGDGVLLLEFHTKMNSLDAMVFKMYEEALDKLDQDEFSALVVGNQAGTAFSAGANVMMVLMAAMQNKWDDLERDIRGMQDLLMRAKYCSKPVVTAPYGLVLGGGAEVAMHSAATQAAGDLWMGLVEVGVGLIPAGGGCKEMLVRYLGDVPAGTEYDPNPFVQAIFKHVALGQVTGSAEEARAWGMLRPTDKVTMDPDALLFDAKRTALGLAMGGYKAPRRRTVMVPGPTGRAALENFLYSMKEGGFASEHDVLIGTKLGHVLCGGDVPWGTKRTEQDILDLEREVFLSLAGEAKTQARIQHMLQKGKPLRN
ncbi:MAG: 3-hydroxyacyl-CoA dehydrogenase/enoyl-CoA hydratase family protein [Deltaproteobacteria bacterium]|nr:3-hydroxyacyl-CoA dehydrogenase/enoyl-CoA hydratase family protein [Deltaproteobacteria bacterium]